MTKRTAVLATALLVAGFCGGCAGGPYKDALRRFGEAGNAVKPMLRAPANPSEEALQSAFSSAVDEALKVGE